MLTAQPQRAVISSHNSRPTLGWRMMGTNCTKGRRLTDEADLPTNGRDGVGTSAA
jgi:hypothetical protein